MEAKFPSLLKSDHNLSQGERKEYGGYLPLELPFEIGEFYRSSDTLKVLPVSSGRAGFYFAAIDSGAKKVYLPFFTCLDTETPFQRLGVEVVKYQIDEEFLPINLGVEDDSVVLWTNYYGNASEKQIATVTNRYKNLIIDNCHAFFSPPIASAYNIYSARKFFGVSDGGYLISGSLGALSVQEGFSFGHVEHLAKQIDVGTHGAYPEHLSNEVRLEADYSSMSKFTQRVLGSVNYDQVFRRRRSNFILLHSLLSEENDFPINLASETHMYYPFKNASPNLREKLIEQRIYTPYWWRHVLGEVPENSVEEVFSRETVLLPIDQRYSDQDMKQISQIVKSAL